MKGAIGNAFILNIVITFMIIFFSLLIGSMAYSKAYKTKNYLMNLIDKYETAGKKDFYDSYTSDGKEWDKEVNEYLGRIGYIITNQKNSCPNKGNSKEDQSGYFTVKDTDNGYDYCIYARYEVKPWDHHSTVKWKYNYMVLVYMKFDLPIIGEFIKLPVTGETKTYIEFN